MVQIKKKMNVTNLFCKSFPEFLLSLAVKSFKEQGCLGRQELQEGRKETEKQNFTEQRYKLFDIQALDDKLSKYN